MGINERLGRVSFIAVFVLLCLVLGIVGCEQRVAGCLDFRAVDVDLGADDACSDCCVFPSLELNFIPIRLDEDADTLIAVLRNTDTLSGEPAVGLTSDDLPDISNLLDLLAPEIGLSPALGFYMHDITLITQNGQRVPMQDTFTVFSGNVEPNFVFDGSLLRITPFSQTSYFLGTLLEAQTFVAVEAKLGLPDNLRSVDIDFQPAGSPLNRNADSLLISAQGNAYTDVDFKYVQQDGNSNRLVVTNAQSQLVRWDLSTPLIYEPSFNLIISLGLPADDLLSLDNGTINGNVFVTDILGESQILETFLSRS